MKFECILLAVFVALSCADNDDKFNYGMESFEENGDDSYGQEDWDQVDCDDLGECIGYPDYYPYAFGFEVDDDGNQCKWCPEGEGDDKCGEHRQSPINLRRSPGVLGGDDEKECPDWHWMQFRDDTCTWDDMKNQFTIQRHALTINVPQMDNGEIDCYSEEKGRRYPRLDYSKGFPEWWWMQRTEIMVPSQHSQEGVHYAAEVVLAHFYEQDHYKNKLGNVAIFLQDYEDAESWAYLDKLICQWRIEEENVREACNKEPAAPYGRCQLFRNQEPTEEWLEEANPKSNSTDNNSTSTSENDPATPPSASPVEQSEQPASTSGPSNGLTSTANPSEASEAPSPSSVPAVGDSVSTSPVAWTEPPPIDCDNSDFDELDFERICSSSNSCCEPVRSSTNFCWDSYDALEAMGASVESACYHCCSEPKIASKPTPEKTGLPKEIKCSAVDNAFRMCKEGSCCEAERSDSSFCTEEYSLWSDSELAQICHYCCSEPKTVGPARRNLRSGSDNSDSLPEGTEVFYSMGRKYALGTENFDEEDEDEQEYFDRNYAEHKRRNLIEGVHEENYEDIEWFPYEWLWKVETEYYFRYEGTQVVPPCFETVHWRPMKDPIRVHKRQIAELNRLLAWRLNPDTCEIDTAGVISDDGNTIKANREIQYYHSTHRMVFCECKDWPSKFESDKEWCDDWEDDTDYTRFYKQPYSFDSDGKWLPDP